jgi:hypothetical protein
LSLIFNRPKIRCVWFVIAVLLLAVLPACDRVPEGGGLFDFENEQQLSKIIWRCKTWIERATQNPPQGAYWLKVELQPDKYPGVRFAHIPKNWKGYGGLAFWAYAPGKAGQSLHLRIDDKNSGPGYDQRYNRIFTLEDSPKRFCAPLDQDPHSPVDFGKVKLLMVFLYDQKTPTTLFLDDFRLVKSCP